LLCRVLRDEVDADAVGVAGAQAYAYAFIPLDVTADSGIDGDLLLHSAHMCIDIRPLLVTSQLIHCAAFVSRFIHMHWTLSGSDPSHQHSTNPFIQSTAASLRLSVSIAFTPFSFLSNGKRGRENHQTQRSFGIELPLALALSSPLPLLLPSIAHQSSIISFILLSPSDLLLPVAKPITHQ